MIRSIRSKKIVEGTRSILSWRGFVGSCLIYCPSSLVARAITGPVLPQKIMHRWCNAVVRDVGVDIQIKGSEKIGSTPSVIVANHASLLDIPVIGSFLDIDYRWVAKKQLFGVPLVGWHLWACGHIAVDRAQHGNLERMQGKIEEVIAKGGSVLFFPEGTRSHDGALRPFRTGAFLSAVRANVPILPIVLEGTERLLVKGSIKFPNKTNKTVHVEVLDRVNAPRVGDLPGRAAVLRDETRAEIVRALDRLRGGEGRAERPTL